MRRIIFIFILVITASASGQNIFHNLITIGRINSVDTTFGKGAIVAIGTQNAAFLCADSVGDSLWTLKIPAYSTGIDAIQLKDSNIILLSIVQDSILFMIKTDKLGSVIWTKYLNMGTVGPPGHTIGYSRLNDTIIVVETIYNTLFFINTNGSIIKQIQVNINNEIGYPSLHQTADLPRPIIISDNKIVIAGTFADSVPGVPFMFYYKAFIICFDFSGNKLWDRILFNPNVGQYGTGPIYIRSMAENNGNYLIGGRYDVPWMHSYQQSFNAMFDSTGNLVWQKSYLDNAETGAITKGMRTAYSILISSILYEVDDSGNVMFINKLMYNNGNYYPSHACLTGYGNLLVGDFKLSQTDTLINYSCGEDTFPSSPVTDYTFYDTTGVVYTFTSDTNKIILSDTTFNFERGFQYTTNCNGFTNIENWPTLSINIFPNPFSESFIIDLGTETAEFEIVITNSLNQILMRRKYCNSSEAIIEQNWPGGVYFVKINSDKRTVVIPAVKN